MTPAEKLLWQELRANKLGPPSTFGTSPKYDRRRSECKCKVFIVVFGGGRVGVVDFYCHKAELVIEVDGDIHDLQQEEDARREKVLNDMGLKIIRFQNDEELSHLSMVVGKIRELTLIL